MLLFPCISKIEEFDPDNFLIDKESHGNVSIYNISYKFLIDFKSLRIRFDKTDGFIRVCDRIKYLVLFRN